MRLEVLKVASLFLIPVVAVFGQTVSVSVDSSHVLGPNLRLWSFFGYDEPNYTYAPNGEKLLGELGSLSSSPVFIRTHNLLTTGNGEASLKWGSTNAYTEDAAGQPIYNWTVLDRIFDTILRSGAKPFVEVGFMPEALSTHPLPYRHDWPRSLYLGWTYPPRDWDKWSALIREWARHEVARYGAAQAASWYWEVWNEPDIAYWHGTPEEYDRLYDVTARAIKSVLPQARVGGPATTGPGNPKAAAYLRQFLQHCERSGAPLDFISFHAKGAPKLMDDPGAAHHLRMDLAKELADAQAGFAIVAASTRFGKLPIILSEADPEGCAACSARDHPQNAYRNGTIYPAYTAAAVRALAEMAGQAGVNLAGVLTWAFEFEGQPPFAGFRSLATDGIDKPILDYFRMAGLLDGNRVAVTIPRDSADPETAAVDAIATRSANHVSILVWNYAEEDLPSAPAEIRLAVADLPAEPGRVLVRHYRIDDHHSNAYTAWLAMNSPVQPTDEQLRTLEAAGQLEAIGSPQWLPIHEQTLHLTFPLPRYALSLIDLNWE